jgi:hypothetical protein
VVAGAVACLWKKKKWKSQIPLLLP